MAALLFNLLEGPKLSMAPVQGINLRSVLALILATWSRGRPTNYSAQVLAIAYCYLQGAKKKMAPLPDNFTSF